MSVTAVVGFLKGLIGPVAGIFQKKQERKLAKESAKAKLLQSRQDGQQTLEMTDADWESVSTGLQDSTWKDEYVTVSVVSIFNLIVLGGIMSAYGHPELLEGVTLAIKALAEVGVELGMILTAVVFAAIGLKIWRA